MAVASKAMGLLALSSLTLSAQFIGGVTATVPFAFVAGQKSYAAGEYRLSLFSSGGFVSIQSLDRKTSGFVLCGRSESLYAKPRSTLVFNRYEGEYFLKNVFFQGNNSGLEFRKSRREMQVEAKAKARHTPETILASTWTPE